MPKTCLHDALQAGVAEGASDWHIREGSTVGVRVDGNLVEMEFSTSRPFIEQFIKEILPPNLKTPFDMTGDADFAFFEEGVGRFRANLHRQRGMLAIALRHVKGKVPSREVLGLPPVIQTIAEANHGIVFVTGATGSGKSTTLAYMIEHMNHTMHQHIITIEDPIEYSFHDDRCVIEQREVGIDSISFESALVHSLRQDPDVIVVGEMRNRITFDTALTAAETGHLVLSTLHTTNASQSIIRVLDMFPHSEREAVRRSLASTLSAIICQRLVPRAGGKGVIPATEVLLATPIVRKLIVENKLERLPLAIEAGVEDGMMSFNRSLLGLVNEGQITEQAALDTSNNPEALRMNLNGIFLNTDSGALIGE